MNPETCPRCETPDCPAFNNTEIAGDAWILADIACSLRTLAKEVKR